SKADDFAFILDELKKVGYFSSNREGGQGSDDIYSFNETIPLSIKCTEHIQGIVKNTGNRGIIANSYITVFNSNSKIIGKSVSDANGKFVFDVKYRSGIYHIMTKKDGFQGKDKQFTMAIDRCNTDLTLEMTPLMASVGTDLVQYLNTDPILFNLNDHTLTLDGKTSLSHVAAYMLKFPEIHIAVYAYTDASGTEQYNQLLSEKRAKTTMEYLMQLGVNTNKLTYKGFGETRLLHDCNDVKHCTDIENQKNRRSECIVSPIPDN
ncbi:MAG: OmpA family protein, partial [Oleispira sp.]|nr:OmpA family protein [Oleispira sp.]